MQSSFKLPNFALLTLLLAASTAWGQQIRSEPNAPLNAKAKLGFDRATLTKLTKDIEAGQFTNTHAVLVELDGSLVYEEYFAGRDERFGQSLGTIAMTPSTLHDLRSISKSVTSILVGICLEEDFKTAVQRPLSEYLPDLTLEKDQQNITLHQVLTMTTGLQWNEMDVSYADPLNDAIRLYGLRDPAKYLLSRPIIHKPGTKWYYNGGCTYLLGEIILKRTGMTVDEFAKAKLFEPLGIKRFEWIGGNNWDTKNPSSAAGLRLTARDLSKIGTLYLNGGQWNGIQIVPQSWVKRSTTRHVPSLGKWSGNGIWGYGYQWRVGNLPGNKFAIAGAGNGNQRLYIIPEDKLVITIYAGQYSLPFEPHSERILTRILQARETRQSDRSN